MQSIKDGCLKRVLNPLPTATNDINLNSDLHKVQLPHLDSFACASVYLEFPSVLSLSRALCQAQSPIAPSPIQA